jgi:integral membrane protein
MKKLSISVQQFKIVAILEGVSFLILLGIAMPLKYIFGLPATTQVVGMAHGILFIAYVLMVVLIRKQLSWNIKITLLALTASVLPFGPFVVDRKLLRQS